MRNWDKRAPKANCVRWTSKHRTRGLGKVREMQELRTRAADQAKRLNMADYAANQLLLEAGAQADLGYPSRAIDEVDSALAISREPDLLLSAADVLAATGQDQRAETLIV